MAAAATEARRLGRALRRREPLGVSERGRRPSRRPGRTRPKPGPGEGPRGGRGSGHFWVQPALALHPRPRGLRTSEGDRGPPVSCWFYHEARKPEPGKASGPVIRAPPRKELCPLPCSDVSPIFPRKKKKHPPQVGRYRLPPPEAKADVSDAKREVASRTLDSSRERGYRRPRCAPEISRSCRGSGGRVSPKDCTGLLEWQQRLVYLGGYDP